MRIGALLLLIFPTLSATAQEPAEVRLAIAQGGKETGREEFTLRPNRARGAPGTTLIAAAHYPATAPTSRLAATLERTPGPEFALAKFQLDVESPSGTTVILAAGSGARLIIRTVAKGSESGRELPGGPDVVLLDDGIFSLYAAVANLATPAGRPLTAIFPRTGKRSIFSARREAGDAASVRVTLAGDIGGTLVTDPDGRLIRLELPNQGIVVSRIE